MINLKELFDKYDTEVTRTEGEETELTIKPEKGTTGLEIIAYGSFDRDPLDRCMLTGLRFPGFIEDTPEDPEYAIDSAYRKRILEALLAGAYRYEMKRASKLDVIQGGAVYVTVGSGDEPLVADYRCVNQAGTKAAYRSGGLASFAYRRRRVEPE